MSKLILGTCALVASVAVAACGGDDDPTKAEFTRDANAICKAGDRKIEATAEKSFTGDQRPSDEQVTKFAEGTAIPTIQGEIDDIRDLGAPSGDDGKVTAILDAAQAAVDKAKADPLIFLSDNDPFDKANQLAAAYGLNACAG